MITYTAKQTQRGDYIIRNQAGNEMARLATEAEAQEWITARLAQNEREHQERAAPAQEQQTFDDSTPDFNALQIRWQTWRTWFYDQLRRKDRRMAQMRDHLDRLDSDLPSYNKHERYLTEDQQRQADANTLYEQAVALDTRIKTARRNRNTTALIATLTESETMIAEMSHYFLSSARPDDAKPRRSGTKPNASVVLTDDELKLIEDKYGGSKSAAIHDGLARVMTTEMKPWYNPEEYSQICGVDVAVWNERVGPHLREIDEAAAKTSGMARADEWSRQTAAGQVTDLSHIQTVGDRAYSQKFHEMVERFA